MSILLEKSPVYHLQKRSCPIFYFQFTKLIIYQCKFEISEGALYDGPGGSQSSIGFWQSSFNFNTVLFYFFLHGPVLFFV